MLLKSKVGYLKKMEDYQIKKNEYDNQIDKRRFEIERAERSIERNMEKLRQLDIPYWIDELVVPIAEHFAKEFGLDYEVYGPFGIRAQVTIYWREDMNKSITEQPVNSLSLVPGDLSKGELFYETGEVTKNHGYSKGSLGYLNGFHKELKPLPDSIDDIRDLIKIEVN